MSRHYCRPYRRQFSRYGFWQLVRDVVGLCITGGLWILWILYREFRPR